MNSVLLSTVIDFWRSPLQQGVILTPLPLSLGSACYWPAESRTHACTGRRPSTPGCNRTSEAMKRVTRRENFRSTQLRLYCKLRRTSCRTQICIVGPGRWRITDSILACLAGTSLWPASGKPAMLRFTRLTNDGNV